MNAVVVRYHEVALKKGNRSHFVERLKRNLAAGVGDLGLKGIQHLAGRLLLVFGENPNAPEITRRLQGIFGVANFSFVVQVSPDLECLKSEILKALDGRRFDSFRVETRRADKNFPLTSPEISRVLGGAVKQESGARVDLENPALTISVEVIPRAAFFSFEKVAGPGGLPVGVSGRAVSLISGGIDSPVAAYRMMQRGLRLTFVHFHSVPYLDRTSQEKVRDLVKLLTRHQVSSSVYLVPFGEIQRQIVTSVPRPLRVVLYRRMMLRIAGEIARACGALALVTGESLAQVASQTLDNLIVIEQASPLLILRPLVGMDKQEIVDQAKRIGSFDISTIPDQDCCQLFVPRHPATKARLDDVLEAESRLDIPGLADLGVKEAAVEEYQFPDPSGAG